MSQYGPPPSHYGLPHPSYGQNAYGMPGGQMMRPQGWICPYCAFNGSPARHSAVSTGGWIMFVVLLVCCFVFCWIPIVTMRTSWSVCRGCGTKVGG
jgi:hypothetical protein